MKLKLGIIGEEHTAAIIEEVLLDYKEFDSSIFLDHTGSAGTFLLLPFKIELELTLNIN